MIQWASQISNKEWNQILIKHKEERILKGWPEPSAEIRKKSDARLYSLVRKVSERAKLTPLGSFHETLYAMFSQFAHQDFTMMADFAHALKPHDTGKPLLYANAKSDVETIIRFADLSSALIFDCVKTDIGVEQI